MAPQQQQPLKAHIKAYEAHVAASAAAGMIKEEDMSFNDSSRSSKPVASPNERIFEDGRPPVAFVYEIASLLFSYPTNVLLSSCIHPSRFLQRLSNGQMEPFLQFALVINGTITLEHEMLSNLTNWESLRDELTIRAREDVDRRFEAFMEVLPPESSLQTIFDLHQASNCLDVLHGYFLLALFSMRIGDIRQARKDLSAAMMLCEKFYLNNLDQVDPVSCATIYDPLISAEHFRRAFWGLYILDCFTTFFTDEFNIINERNICLRLPCHHLLWLHNDHSSVNEPLLNIENVDTPAAPDTNIFLKQLVKLLTLSSRINRFVRLCADGGNFLGDAELEEFSQLEKSLNNWLSVFLPSSKGSSTGSSTANVSSSPDDQNLPHELCHGDLLFLYTLHQTMLIILYKAHLRSKDSHKYHISTPFGLQAFKRVHRISRNLTQLLKQKHPLLQANGCTGAHPLLSFCLYHVCLVHLNVIYQKQIQIPLAERQLAEEQFNFGQKLILDCYESWRIAERYYRILQEMNSTGLLEDFEGLGSLENVTFSSSLPKQQQVEGSLKSCSSIGSLALGDLDLSPVLSMPVVHRRNVSTSYTREINTPNKLPTMRSMSLIETFAMPPSLSLDRMCTSLEEIRPSTSIGVSHHEALSAYSLWGGDVAAAAAVAVAATGGGAPGYAFTNHWVPLPGEGFVSPQSLHCDGLSRQASNHRLASAHTLLESDLDGDGGFLEEEINVLEINALNSDDNSNVVDSETDEKKSTRKKRRRQPNRKRN